MATHIGQFFTSMLYGFSQFWRSQFKDREVLETIQRTANILEGEYQEQLLQYVMLATPQTAPLELHQHWMPVDIRMRDMLRATINGTERYVVALPTVVSRLPRLQNKVYSPTMVLEPGENRHYILIENSAGNCCVAFKSNPFDLLGFQKTTNVSEPRLIAGSSDGQIEFGRPNSHILLDPDPTSNNNTRYDERRVFNTTGVVYQNAFCTAYNDSDLLIDTSSAEDLPTLLVGSSIVIGAPYNVTRTVVASPELGIIQLDAPVNNLTAASSFRVTALRTEIFKPEDVGLTINVYLSVDGASVLYARTIEEYLSPLSVKLSEPITNQRDSYAAIRTASYDHALRTLTFDPSSALVESRDFGAWLYVDTSAGSGFVEIETATDFTAAGYAQTVTINDPFNVLTASDATSEVSKYANLPKIVNAQWELYTNAEDTSITMWAPDVFTPSDLLSKKFGVLVGKTSPVTTPSYKNTISGVMKYYNEGPTLSSLETVLNVISGLPVAQFDGERLLRTEAVTDGTVIVTDRGRYLLPTDAVRTDILTQNPTSVVFKALEPLSNVFTVSDETKDPLWFRNNVVPEFVMPDANPMDRFVNDELIELSINGSWNIGDPGVYINGLESQQAESVVTDGFVLGSTLYVPLPTFWPQDVGKSLYVDGQRVTILGYASRTQVTVSRDFTGVFEPTLLSVAEATGSAITIEDVPVQPFYYDRTDVGRQFYYTAGARFVVMSSRVTNRTAYFKELDGTVLTEPVTPTTIRRPNTIVFIRQNAYRYSAGFVAMRGFAGANMFGVQYSIGPVAGQIAAIQKDLRDIVLSGRLAHTYVLDLPYSQFIDKVGVGDNSVEVTVLPGTNAGTYIEDTGTTSTANAIGNGHWYIGDVFQLSPNSLSWVYRHNQDTVLPAIAIPAIADRNVPHAIDSTDNSVLWINLESYQAGQTYEVEVYTWNGTTYVATGITALFDTDAPNPQAVSVAATFHILRVVKLSGAGPELYAIQTGLEEQHPFIRVNIGAFPVFQGTIAASDDELTTSQELYDMDKSRDLYLTYEAAPGIFVTDYVRIKAITSANTCDLVYMDTDTPYSPAFTGAVDIQLGPQRAWGQTSVSIGSAQPALVDPHVVPNVVAPNSSYSVELPVQVTLLD